MKKRNMRKKIMFKKGETYGSWTVVTGEREYSGKRPIFKIKCSCGTVAYKRPEKILDHISKECTCSYVHDENTLSLVKPAVAGTKVGIYTILDGVFVYTNNSKNPYYRVQCSCGNIKLRSVCILMRKKDNNHCVCKSIDGVKVGWTKGGYTITDATPVQVKGSDLLHYHTVCDCGIKGLHTFNFLHARKAKKCHSEHTRIRKGDVYANYTVISDPVIKRNAKRNNKQENMYVLCRCICGKEKYVKTYNLYIGYSISCGCSTISYKAERQSNYPEYKLPLSVIWGSMMARCYNPNNSDYHRYGGRGIKVSEQLQDVRLFNDLLLPTWKPGLTLDRIDVNGDYELSNLRWATSKTQSNNKRITVRCIDVLTNDEISITQLAKRYNIKRATVDYRHKRGFQGIDLILRKEGFYLTKWPTLLSAAQSRIIDTLSRLPIEVAIKVLDIELADASVIKHLHCNK